MGMPVKPISLGYLNGIFETDETSGLCVTEYRDSITTEVKISGPGVEDNKEKIKNSFFAWYPPQGYSSSVKEATNPVRGFMLVLHRYLSCD
jgi:hypothetical protein